MPEPHVKVVCKGTTQWAELRGEFVEAQTGRCAICDCELTDPCLDHCHVTGTIRGALCSGCNTKLGWYENRRREIERYLSRSAEYEAHRSGDQPLRTLRNDAYEFLHIMGPALAPRPEPAKAIRPLTAYTAPTLSVEQRERMYWQAKAQEQDEAHRAALKAISAASAHSRASDSKA